MQIFRVLMQKVAILRKYHEVSFSLFKCATFLVKQLSISKSFKRIREDKESSYIVGCSPRFEDEVPLELSAHSFSEFFREFLHLCILLVIEQRPH